MLHCLHALCFWRRTALTEEFPESHFGPQA